MNMQKSMVKAIEKTGFEVIAHERDGKNCLMKKVYFDKVPEKSRLISVLQQITPSFRIRFFDDDPDTYDEEGGYCQAIILDEENVLFMEKNHDWCKEWHTISMDELATFMQYNWSQDDIWGKYKNYFILEENKYCNLVTFCNLQVQQPA